MNAFEFDGEFDRLKTHFRLPSDVDAGKLGIEWFDALKHLHVDAVHRGVSDVIQRATDTFFPPIGLVLEAIRIRMAGMDRTKDKCATCHGSGWIEVWPAMRWSLVYRRNARCPDCGIPAPDIKKHQSERPLSKEELEAYEERRENRDIMPEWAKARHPSDPNMKNELREFMAALRDRLFRHDDHNDP